MATKTKTATTKRKPGRPFEGLDRMMSIRTSTEDVERVWEVAASLGQKHQAVARAALRIGLAVLERTPGAYVGEDAAQRPPRASNEASRKGDA